MCPFFLSFHNQAIDFLYMTGKLNFFLIYFFGNAKYEFVTMTI